MRDKAYLIVSSSGLRGFRKKKPALNWDEIACKIEVDVPDELFNRPQLEAVIQVEDVPNTVDNPEVILNTKELIEQQTGAKIDFSIKPLEVDDEENCE